MHGTLSTEQRPPWRKDTSECEGCNIKFSLTVRRHHCRRCGHVFCDPCCNSYVPLPAFGFKKPQRVCTRCCSHLENVPATRNALFSRMLASRPSYQRRKPLPTVDTDTPCAIEEQTASRTSSADSSTGSAGCSSSEWTEIRRSTGSSEGGERKDEPVISLGRSRAWTGQIGMEALVTAVEEMVAESVERGESEGDADEGGWGEWAVGGDAEIVRHSTPIRSEDFVDLIPEKKGGSEEGALDERNGDNCDTDECNGLGDREDGGNNVLGDGKGDEPCEGARTLIGGTSAECSVQMSGVSQGGGLEQSTTRAEEQKRESEESERASKLTEEMRDVDGGDELSHRPELVTSECSFSTLEESSVLDRLAQLPSTPQDRAPEPPIVLEDTTEADGFHPRTVRCGEQQLLSMDESDDDAPPGEKQSAPAVVPVKMDETLDHGDGDGDGDGDGHCGAASPEPCSTAAAEAGREARVPSNMRASVIEDSFHVVTKEDEVIPKLRIVILLVGSRGDVQPFVALSKRLLEDGHHIRIATHECFRNFVTSHNIEFFPLAGDPQELMQFMVENSMFSVKFVTEGLSKHRNFVKGLLQTAWQACVTPLGDQSRFIADAIIANPPSFAGIHIAEKLGIPLHIMFTMPWTPTAEFCSPFVTSETANTAYTNRMSFAMVDKLIWLGVKDMINTFRVRTLSLPPIRTITFTGHRMLADNEIPHTYCFSEHVLPRPGDWPSHVDVCGYWFLDNCEANWDAPADLTEFLAGGDAPVFIGFGSIVVPNPDRLTEVILESVRLSGKRAIIQKGWAGMDPANLPDDVIMIGRAPHDWLFERVCCVVHHGGAGTTAAGLRAGKPTVIVPFFGDQFFWGRAVARMQLGAGPVPYDGITPERLGTAIREAVTPGIEARCREQGRLIRNEDGVGNAVSSFYQHLPLSTMQCVLDVTHLATVFCHDCGFRFCLRCSMVVHSCFDGHQLSRNLFQGKEVRVASIGPAANSFMDGLYSLGAGVMSGAQDLKEKTWSGEGFLRGLSSMANHSMAGTREFFETTASGIKGTAYQKDPLGMSVIVPPEEQQREPSEAECATIMERFYGVVAAEAALMQEQERAQSLKSGGKFPRYMKILERRGVE